VVQTQTATVAHSTQLTSTNGIGGRQDSTRSDATIHSMKDETPVMLMEDEV